MRAARLLAGLALLAVAAAHAQPTTRVARVGWLAVSDVPASNPLGEAFRRGLRDLGWVEGRNLVIERRSADGRIERLPDLAAELVRLNVDVVFAPAQPSAVAARRVTATVPIVFTLTDDPVALGFVASLARPGWNMTGQSQLYPELVAKRGPADLDGAFMAAARGGAMALSVGFVPVTFVHRARVAELALKQRLPSMAPFREFAEEGGLMAYAPSIPEMFRRSAVYVDKILRGAKPADLPVEQPTRFELTINLRTAKALGLMIPQSLLLRADQVIQ